MIEQYKSYVHTPPHLHRSGAKYFITASTFGKAPLFDEGAREKLLSSLSRSCENHGWTLEDWVILDDHYHLMVNAPDIGKNTATRTSTSPSMVSHSGSNHSVESLPWSKSMEHVDRAIHDGVNLKNERQRGCLGPKNGNAVASVHKTDIASFVAEYHKFTALFIKKNNPSAAGMERIFNNYWDSCITFEKSYYARLNYLYHNPVKHGYVQCAEEYRWGVIFADIAKTDATSKPWRKHIPLIK